MAHLRTFQAGPHSAASQKLLNECSAARVTLLNPEKRAEYDRQLREKLAANRPHASGEVASSEATAFNIDANRPHPNPLPEGEGKRFPPDPQVGAPRRGEGASLQSAAQPLPMAIARPVSMAAPLPLAEAAPVIVSNNDSAGPAGYRRAARSTPVWRQPAVLGVVGALAVFAGIVVTLMRGGKPSPEVAANSTPNTVAIAPAAPPNTDRIAPTKNESSAIPTTAPSLEPPPAAPSPPAAADFEILAAKWGTGDKWVDVTEDVRRRVTGNRLMMMVWPKLFGNPTDPAPGEGKRLSIRYRSRGKEYTADYFDLWFVYLDGNPLAPPTRSPGDLELLEARYGGGGAFVDVLPRLRGHLHNGRLSVAADIFAADTAAELEQRGISRSVYKVLWVRYRNNTGEHFMYGWNSEPLVLDARTPPAAGPPIDLLKLIDLRRDVVEGAWQMDAGALRAPGTNFARLEIPYDPPDDYMLTAAVDAAEEIRDISALLLVGGKQVMSVADGFLGNRSGLQIINGKLLSEDNPTCRWRSAKLLEQGRMNTLVYIVHPHCVRVLRDGADIVRWSGNAGAFAIVDRWRIRSDRRLSLQAYDRPFRVHKLELVPIKPARASMLIVGESGAPLDVMKAIELDRDRLHGDWQFTGQTLVTPGAEGDKLQLPAIVPESYQLDLVAEREAGSDSLTFTIPIAGAQGTLSIDSWQGKLSGLEKIDERRIDANETKHEGSIFADGKPHAIHITVRKNHVRLVCDGKPLVDWTGDVGRLKPLEAFPFKDRIYVGDWQTRYRLTNIKIRAFPGDATDASPPALAAGTMPSEPAPPRLAGPAIDLLRQIDLQRDAPAGDWQMVDGALVSPETPFARLELPPPPAPEYQVTIVGERVRGGWGLSLVVAIDGRQVMVTVDGHNGQFSGLELLDGKNCAANETARGGRLLVDGKPATFVYTVRRDAIQLTLDGRTIIDWRGDTSRLSMIDGFKLRDPNRLALCEFRTICRISKIEIAPLSEPDGSNVARRARGFAGLASDVDTRLPEPDEAAQKAARTEMRKKFVVALKNAAKSVEKKRSLAAEMAQKAAADGDQGAMSYVLFKQAIDLAESAGELELAWQTIDQLAKTFAVNDLALRHESLSEIGKGAGAKSPERARQLTDAACRLMTAALAAGDAAALKKAATQAQSFARRTNDKDLQKEVSGRAAGAGEWASELANVAKARETLKTSPDDPAANSAVGRFQLCALGDFDAALPKLAKSGETAWKKLADDELALANRRPTGPRTFVNGRLVTRSGPAEAQSELAAADAWWSRGEEEPWPGQHYLRMRAAKWYGSAYRSLLDAGRARAGERLKTLLAADDGFSHWELFNWRGIQQGDLSGETVRIDGRGGGLETTVEYGGPIDVTLSVRTSGTEIRFGSHNWGWNWKFKVTPNEWHTVRYIITPVSQTAIVDGALMQNEALRTARELKSAPVYVDAANDNVLELRKFIVKES